MPGRGASVWGQSGIGIGQASAQFCFLFLEHRATVGVPGSRPTRPTSSASRGDGGAEAATYSAAAGLEPLLTTAEAARLLAIERVTILDWIRRDRIPYVWLPAGGRRTHYRISRRALLCMLGGEGDLAEEYRAAVAELHRSA